MKLLSRFVLIFLLNAISIVPVASTNRPAEPLQDRSQEYEPTDVARLRRAVTIENWDDGGNISRFAYLHTSEIFPTAAIYKGTNVMPLEEVPNPAIGAFIVSKQNGRTQTLAEYLADHQGFDGFIVLHHGKIVYESYPHMRSQDKHLIMSVTKAIIGTAVGILEDRGEIDINRPVADYIQALKATGWETVRIRDILEMASGMEGIEHAPESYTDPTNKHYQYEASLGWLPKMANMPVFVKEEETYRYLASLKQLRKPGEVWAYNSTNTAILGWLLEEVTNKSIATVLSEEIWAPMGAESDAQIVVNSKGIAVAHGGLIVTLRDLARFGLLYTPSWNKTAHKRIISEKFMKRILENGRVDLVKDRMFGPKPAWLSHVAYQWDAVTKQSRFFKGGFGGQLLYVAPQKDVVIAYFGTNKTIDDLPPELNLNEFVDSLF